MVSLLSGLTSLLSSCVKEKSYSPEIEHEILKEFEEKFTAKAQERPALILIGGFQGAGKSTLIARIQETYSINVISTDSLRQSLFDRGVKLSPEFSNHVSALFNTLVIKSLKLNANTLIDANSHSKRIAEMNRLLNENPSRTTTLKIFLNASEATLRNRVKSRQPTTGSYQGTESDLTAALTSTKIDLKDYDIIVDTDNATPSDVFESVNKLISPHLKPKHYL